MGLSLGKPHAGALRDDTACKLEKQIRGMAPGAEREESLRLLDWLRSLSLPD